jgi:hypothetical protein
VLGVKHYLAERMTPYLRAGQTSCRIAPNACRMLTYMSIRDLISDYTREDQKRLFWHKPAIQDHVKRHMLISVDLRNALVGPWKTTAEGRRFGQLRGDLDAFVEGRRISVANHPYEKDKTAYIARVDPVSAEIWDIRSIDPSPSIRVLGCFVEKDLFIALAWSYRDNLDGPGGLLWEAFIQRAQHEWRRLFLTYIPCSGSEISDYISENFFAV